MAQLCVLTASGRSSPRCSRRGVPPLLTEFGDAPERYAKLRRRALRKAAEGEARHVEQIERAMELVARQLRSLPRLD
jgi:hypothetical protein